MKADEKLGKVYYNQGVTDAVKFLREKTEDFVLLLKE